MSRHDCAWEDRIQNAVTSRVWDDKLRAHVAGCAACADLMLVSKVLLEHATHAGAHGQPPEPGPIWWRARLHARQAALARATRPIVVWERITATSGIAALLALLWRSWPSVAGTIASAGASGTWLMQGTAGETVAISLTLAGAALLTFRIWIALDFDRRERSRG